MNGESIVNDYRDNYLYLFLIHIFHTVNTCVPIMFISFNKNEVHLGVPECSTNIVYFMFITTETMTASSLKCAAFIICLKIYESTTTIA